MSEIIYYPHGRAEISVGTKQHMWVVSLIVAEHHIVDGREMVRTKSDFDLKPMAEKIAKVLEG